MRDVRTVLDSGLDVFAQNVETVRRLTHPVRDPRAGYEQTIEVLRTAKVYKPRGAHENQLDAGSGRDGRGNSRDPGGSARGAGRCADPGPVSAPHAESFERRAIRHARSNSTRYREWALELGFLECVSGPLVRSSYRAEQALARNNAGLDNAKLAASRRPVLKRFMSERCR